MSTHSGSVAPVTFPSVAPIEPLPVPGYGRFTIPWLQGAAADLLRPNTPAARLNARLRGYPRNHDMKVVAGPRVIPSRRLHSRWTRIASLYPDHLTSLLDVGSCKGYFVLEAATRPSCRA